VPDSVMRWSRLMLDLLESLPVAQLRRILPQTPYGSSKLGLIYDADPARRAAGWVSYRRALAAWMTGEPLISVASEVHTRPVNGSAGRGSRDPLPRVITVVGNGFRFGLSLAAGSMAAIVATGRENDPVGPWEVPAECLRSLNLLPLAIRYGADSPETLAWIRAGVHTRRAAHMLNSVVPPPAGLSDDELQRWAFGRFQDLAEGAIVGATDAAQDVIISAIRTTRNSR
jgi:hypothetical protein